MRRGVADMHRRATVSQKANERYWDALSTVDDTTRFSEFTRTLEQPCQYRGRRVRALRLFQADDHQGTSWWKTYSFDSASKKFRPTGDWVEAPSKLTYSVGDKK